MLTLEGSPVWAYDIEVFPNYFLALFFNGEKWRTYEDPQVLRNDLHSFNLVLAGFNNLKYDDVILRYCVQNPLVNTSSIYEISTLLINDENKDLIFKLIYADKPWRMSIDVFQLLNAKSSLKEWECKYGSDLVAESPCDFNKPLDEKDIPKIREYCKNDVVNTWKILNKKWELVTLRTTLKEMYGLTDLVYCMSEQGVAQHTFLTLHRHRTGENRSTVNMKCQENIDNSKKQFELTEIISNKVVYKTDPYNQFLSTLKAGSIQKKDEESWKIVAENFNDEIELSDRRFAIGVGGIHSIDTPSVICSDDNFLIVDLDVASYYPSIIINENLYPKQLGPGFVDDMKLLRDQRLRAKEQGNKVIANALKIVINATFGKLDDKYSPLRSVPDAKRVTINGQLFILMLVESLHMAGAEIVSANTDGVTIKWSRSEIYSKLEGIICEWQTNTGYILERSDYSRYIRRDINNYIAVYTTGKVKLKGVFESEPDGAGKWHGRIIKKAAVEYLIKSTPIEDTIDNETDIKMFLFYQRCKSNSIMCIDKQPVGQSVRWYAAIMGGRIERHSPTAKSKWTKLDHGGSAMLALDISNMNTIPCDIDKQHYIDKAKDLIESVTCS